jgi:hypothetical protein
MCVNGRKEGGAKRKNGERAREWRKRAGEGGRDGEERGERVKGRG